MERRWRNSEAVHGNVCWYYVHHEEKLLKTMYIQILDYVQWKKKFTKYISQWFSSAVSNILSNSTQINCLHRIYLDVEINETRCTKKIGKTISPLLCYLKMQRLDTRNMSNLRLNLIWIYLLIPFIVFIFFFTNKAI